MNQFFLCFVTDATLILNPDCNRVSLTGVVVNTFTLRSEDFTGGLSSNLPHATAPSQFYINRFGLGPLHYFSSRADFGFEFSEIFVF